MTHYDVIIIGSGIAGLCTAYRAVQLDAKVLLIDRHDPGRATDAGAGILAPETSPSGRTWYDFAMSSVNYYGDLMSLLGEDGLVDAGLETGHSHCPKLLVAVTEEEVPAFDEAKRVILARQAERGDGGRDPIRQISAREAQELLPPLADAAAALYQPVAGRVDGRVLSAALRWALDRRGVEHKDADAGSLIIEHGRVVGVETARGEQFSAGATVIAGGAWSSVFGDQLGVQIPVEPQRGQIIHLDLGNTDTRTWPIVNGFRGHYMVPWPDHRIAVGATRETGSGFDPRTTAAGIHEVLGEALYTAPGLAHAEIREIRVGLRPYTQDGLPVLGPVAGVDGIFLVTGHGATGLQLGPYSGKLVAEQALGYEIDYDLAPFSVHRF